MGRCTRCWRWASPSSTATVWFFDLYYGAAAALGGYGVFYLRSQESLGGLHAVNSPYVNGVFAAVVAAVVAWALYEAFYSRLRARAGPTVLRAGWGLLAVGAGAYAGVVLSYPADLHVMLSPAVGLLTALAAAWALRQGGQAIVGSAAPPAARRPHHRCRSGYRGLLRPPCRRYPRGQAVPELGGVLSAGGDRGARSVPGLYVYMRQRARSPLVMLVATLGILLVISAFIVILFQSAPRPLPEPFGSEPWAIGGAYIKGFNVFTIGVALAGFVGLLVFLKKTAFGRTVRAIGDDEEVSKVVGGSTRRSLSPSCSSSGRSRGVGRAAERPRYGYPAEDGAPASAEGVDRLGGRRHRQPLRSYRRRIRLGVWSSSLAFGT